MDDNLQINSIKAIQDFRSARHKASLKEILSRFTGNTTELLSFEEVRQKLKAQISQKTILTEIPIDAIVGSVNRYQDFDRDFLPGENVSEERWANIEMANYGLAGLPPIEVYQIGEVYFVSDGNHRVSVARQLGSKEIQAYVNKVQTRVSLTKDVQPEDLIIKSEYIEFLEHTNLDQLRPASNLAVTVPGQYGVLEEHIGVHRYFMGIEQQREIPNSEAIVDWYDKVYLPVVQIIRDHGLLHDFPDRTETDLYLWIATHRAALEEELNSRVEVTNAAADLAGQYSQRPSRVISRLGNKFVKSLVPNILDAGPAPGEWRQSILNTRKLDRLFHEILTPINGREDGWWALEQAIVIARQEESKIQGLYIILSEEEVESSTTLEIKHRFSLKCEQAGIKSELLIQTGDIPKKICELARHNDLVVMNLSYPPESSMVGRLYSGIRNLVHICPRPILFTPQVSRELDCALLAYDGSLKAQEALFIATYLSSQWKVPLTVLTIDTRSSGEEIQADARNYLEDHNVNANYLLIKGRHIPQIILDHIEQQNIEILLLGGYGHSPIKEVLQGSDVDEILRLTKIPVLICR